MEHQKNKADQERASSGRRQAAFFAASLLIASSVAAGSVDPFEIAWHFVDLT